MDESSAVQIRKYATMDRYILEPTMLSWNTSIHGNGSFYRNQSLLEVPLERSLTLGILLGCISLGACFGNILVILSVYTNQRLRTVTNCFVVSLATSDLLVAILVLPLGIKVEITGTWELGVLLCDMWVTCDVMLCTASILNLCCISLDRYFAITNPLVYATKRSKRLAWIMIAGVWVAAIIITLPPILGWQEEGRWLNDTHCNLTSDPGYVIYSSLGSFYIPLIIMIFVYVRIFKVAHEREKVLGICRHSFKANLPRRRGKFREQDYSFKTESICLTDSVKGENKEADIEGEMMEQILETSLAQQQKEQTVALASGKCLSVRRLHEGLVMSSALAMTDIARAHRQNLRKKNCTTTSSLTSPAYTKTTSTTSSTTSSYMMASPGSERHKPLMVVRQHRKHNNHNHVMCTNNTNNHHHHSPSSHHRSPGKSHALQNHSMGSPLVRTKHGDFLAKKDDKRRERAVLRRERKTAKTLCIVMGCFVVCWLPFFLMYIIAPFCDSCTIHPTMSTFFTWLGYFNSVINPFIYALYNRDFRHSFYKMTFDLLCRLCRRRR